MRAMHLLAVFLILACSRTEEPPAPDQTPSENRTADEARIRELEAQARALARTGGCARADQCAAAPMGAKPCGGPRTYLVYCKATTDEAALLRALDELKLAEEAYIRANGLMSDCMFVAPPEVRVIGGSCVAAEP